MTHTFRLALRLAAAGLLLPAPALSTVRLVKDLNTAGSSSQPELLAKMGGDVFFVARTNEAGTTALWKTDGAEAEPIATVVSPASWSVSGVQMTEVAGTLYFLNAVSGDVELWKSDGTAAGTARVATPPQGGGGNDAVKGMAAVGGKLFFGAFQSGSGYDLWTSDGTEAGTAMVADLDLDLVRGGIVDHGGIAYFAANDAAGVELWRSDGTAAGTWRVADLNPGAGSSYPQALAEMGGLLYFACFGTDDGAGLWVTDGTEAGTTLVAVTNPSVGIGLQSELTVMGDRLFFSAYSPDFGTSLWTSDGTTTGTIRLGSGYPFSITAIGDTVYFDGYTNPTGHELWKTDGTVAGTVKVAATDSPRGFVAYAGEVWFSAWTSTEGRELWKTDGTTAGTVRVKDIRTGVAGSEPGPFFEAGGVLLFAADGDDGQRELWSSDGTGAGTSLLLDIAAPPSRSSALSLLTAVDGRLAFARTETYPGELWLSSGTAASTSRSTAIDPYAILDWNGTMTIAGSIDGYYGLWARHADGVLQELHDDFAGSPAAIGDSIYFGNFDTAWRLDDQGALTELATVTGPTGCSIHACVELPSSPRSFHQAGTRVVFVVTASTGFELWGSDGTAAGTAKLAGLDLPYLEAGIDGIASGGKFFFAAGAPGATSGQELFATDGTAAGSAMVADLDPGADGSSPSDFAAMGGRVYFAATDAGGGRELWISDGTAAGTARVADLVAGAGGSAPSGLVVLNGALYFAATDASGDRELWTSDGSESGTARFADLNPGPASSNPGDLTVAGAKLYFRADDGAAGAEPWSTDGTSAATQRLADVNAGAAGSDPAQLTMAGANLYFTALTAEHGRELWAVDLPSLCGNGAVDPGETCDDGGTAAGDGCDAGCTLESCGNGALDAGEQCDDGNRIDNDGCSAACALDCLDTPQDNCRESIASGTSRLTLKSDPTPSRNQMGWNWKKGEATAKSDFGNPVVDTAYQVCVYDGSVLILSANVPAGGDCGGVPCWTEDTSGFRYKRRSGGPMQMKMRSSTKPGSSQIGLKVRGASAMPDLEAVSSTVRVQLRNADACWNTGFSPPFDRQAPDVLQAVSD